MAERRMFTQKIVDSDAFLDMPLSSQALYFHLNMRADDDGFVNNPKKIQRMIGASEDDLKLLVAKRFVLGFETGVIVIKHWRMHNLLRKDRYNPTQYQEEMALLDLKDNGSYTEKALEIPLLEAPNPNGNQMATTWQPNGNQMATQDRIGKDSIGKVRIGEERKEEGGAAEPAPASLPPPEQTVIDLYQYYCRSYPDETELTEARKSAIGKILKQYTMDDVAAAFRKAEASKFLRGVNNTGWKASLDWMLDVDNMKKILSGKYDDHKQGSGSGRNAFNTYQKRNDVDYEAVERMARAKLNPPKTAGEDPDLMARAEDMRRRLAN